MDYLYKSVSFKEAESRLQFILECIGELLDKETLNMILKVALENKHRQILYAARCKKWLIEQLRDNANVDKDIYEKFKGLEEYKDEL
ncbi:MAG: hypothetical protein M1409_08280 [Actinobacteria bacterium]|nr:hypothetical protein [Actinomycetota bacterium]